MANLLGQIIIWAKATLSASEVPADGQPLYDKANKRLHIGDNTKTTAQQRTAGEYLPPKSEVDTLISDAIDANPGVTDHGALSGLGDDDHTQYHTNARGDARYSQLGHQHTLADVTDAGTAAAEDAATTSAANRVVKVGGTGKIDTSFLPDSILGQVEYQGTWAASTNTPAIPAPSSANKGHYYVASSAVGAGHGYSNVPAVDFAIGDWIICNGSAWQKVDNTDAVSSVFGRTGPVVIAPNDYPASYIQDDSQLDAGNVRDALNTLKGVDDGVAVSVQNLIDAQNAQAIALDTKADKTQSTFSKQYAVLTSGGLASVNAEEDFEIVTGMICMDMQGEFLIPGQVSFEPSAVSVALNVPATITLAGLPMNASVPIQDDRRIMMLVFGTPAQP